MVEQKAGALRGGKPQQEQAQAGGHAAQAKCPPAAEEAKREPVLPAACAEETAQAAESVQTARTETAQTESGQTVQTEPAQTAQAEPAQTAQAAEPAAPVKEKSIPAERRRGKVYFTASRIAKLALLTALAYVVTFLEFPVFPAAPFLQLDFSNVFVLLGGYLYGPLAAILISLLKECLSLLDSGTNFVGEVANFLINFAFFIVPTVVYRYKKGLKWVIPMLAAGTLLQVAASLPVNRYINFPLFMGEAAASYFAGLWWYVLLFNLIKGVAVSAVTVLLYKRVSWLFKKF